jgi:Flp pilus assembly protein TadD
MKNSRPNRFTTSNPNNVDVQRDVAITYGRIGDMQSAQGDLVGAKKSYNEALAIIECLATFDPTNARLQHDLSTFYWEIATCLSKQGDSVGTLDALRKGREVVLGLEQRSPENAKLIRELDAFEEWITRLGQ